MITNLQKLVFTVNSNEQQVLVHFKYRNILMCFFNSKDF
jgi:hypothetical protein